jgi:hypothetical protein
VLVTAMERIVSGQRVMVTLASRGQQCDLEEMAAYQFSIGLTSSKTTSVVEFDTKAATKAQELDMLNRKKSYKDHSYHSNDLTRVVKGVAPMAKTKVKKAAADLILAKVKADMACDGPKRMALPDFVQNQLMSQYGLKKIAVKNIQQLAVGVRKHSNYDKMSDYDPLIHLFGKLTGICNVQAYSSIAVNFVLDLLELIFSNNKRAPAKVTDTMSDVLLNDGSLDASLVIRSMDTLMVAYRQVSPSELFRQVDNDGSGSLEIDELQTLLTALGGTEDVHTVMAQINLDGSGEINLAQFEYWWTRFGCLRARIIANVEKNVCSVTPSADGGAQWRPSIKILTLVQQLLEYWGQIESTIPMHAELLSVRKLHDCNHTLNL